MNLYVVHVGFYDQELGIYELHSNILVAAESVNSAKHIVKNKEIFVKNKMHIDGIQEILHVDGYDVLLVKNENNIVNNKFDYDEVRIIE